MKSCEEIKESSEGAVCESRDRRSERVLKKNCRKMMFSAIFRTREIGKATMTGGLGGLVCGVERRDNQLD